MDILDFKQAKLKIRAISRAVGKLDADIHQVACSGLVHYVEHNDATTLTDLCKAVAHYDKSKGKFDGRSVRGADLRSWVKEFGGLKWSMKAYGNEGGWVINKQAGINRINNNIDIDRAIANPFYQYIADKEPTAFDPVKAAEQLLARITKVIDGKSEKQFLEDKHMANATVLANVLKYYVETPDAIYINEEEETELPTSDKIPELSDKAA